jgi:glycine/D-amino acid oxidase-like deaminating enzyme
VRVVICGGGVIGAAIAYFLTRRGVRPIVVERTGVACAASGKSGGFLALDWCDGTPLEALARRSFALHAGLPAEIGGDWGYRRLTTYSGFAGAAVPRRRGGDGAVPWLDQSVMVDRRLGSPATTAQLHPARFTAALMRAAEAGGAELRLAEVTGLLRRDGRVAGVEVTGGTLDAEAVVVAMGPWSIIAARWLRLPAVYGLKGHSLVFDVTLPAEALFLDYQDDDGASFSPEIYPRADGTTYVCAISSDSPLPVDPATVVPDEGAIERLAAMCARLSPALGRARVLAQQACHRPVTADGVPLIGPVPSLAGAYVATGHSVWGMLNAPATGEAMAELIVDGAARSVDLSPFDPGRLPPASLR